MAPRGLIFLACLCFVGLAFAQAPTQAPVDAPVAAPGSNSTANETVVIRYNWNPIPAFIDICNATRCPPFRSPARSQAAVTPWFARSYPSGIALPTFLVFGGRSDFNKTNFAYDDFWSFYIDPSDDFGVYRDVNNQTVATRYQTNDPALFGVQHAAGALVSIPTNGFRDQRAIFIGGTIETNLTRIDVAWDYTINFVVASANGGVGISPSQFAGGGVFRGTATASGQNIYYIGGFVNIVGVGAVLNNTVRVFSGTNTGVSAINATLYAPPSGWPAPRYDHAAILYNDTKIYVFGGTNITHFFNDTWVFNTADQSWTELFPRVERAVNDTATGPITVPRRAGHKLVTIFDKYTNRTKILCLGGYSDPNLADMAVWEYEPDNNVWRPLNATGPSPPARSYFNVLPMSDHQFIMFGGENSTQVLPDIYHFNYWSRDAYPVAPPPPPVAVITVQAPFIRYPLAERSENNWIAIGAAVLLVALIVVVIILKFVERRV